MATADGTLLAEYDYDPYGRLIRETGPQAATCPFCYSTNYRDPDLELYYYGYRWYDAAAMKWLTPDPIGERGGANLTAFCSADPINKVDPLGLATLEEVLANGMIDNFSELGELELTKDEVAWLLALHGKTPVTPQQLIENRINRSWNPRREREALRRRFNVDTDDEALQLWSDRINHATARILAWQMWGGERAKAAFRIYPPMLELTAIAAQTPLLCAQAHSAGKLAQNIVSARSGVPSTPCKPIGNASHNRVAQTTAMTKYEPWPKAPVSPHADGFLFGARQVETAQPGQIFSRLGEISGRYVSPPGTSLSARGLPAGYQGSESLWQVVKPFQMEAGLAAPWQGSSGMGIQYRLPQSIQSLWESGYLAPAP